MISGIVSLGCQYGGFGGSEIAKCLIESRIYRLTMVHFYKLDMMKLEEVAGRGRMTVCLHRKRRCNVILVGLSSC